MFDKIGDAANILKAKITKDDLQQKLIQATSEQNWQAPTNILHEIANAAYNYQKWQKINDFIWDKLKKKSTWRKIVKALNLVDFLLRNGPPSTVSSFKYDIYQFRSFADFQLYDEGVDRGQAIRQKSKQIVQLLSNDEHLEEQRQKARKIRQKMSGVTGGSGYGGYGGGSGGYGYGGGGDGKYESYNNKNYNQKPKGNTNYGGNNQYNGGGLGVYGDYNYGGKSTLDKYKNDKNEKDKGKTEPQKPVVDITGFGNVNANINSITTPNIITPQQPKKPFQKVAPKLSKPDSKPRTNPNTSITQNTQNTQNKNINPIDDDDIFNTVSTPTTTATTQKNGQNGNVPSTPVQTVQTTQSVNYNNPQPVQQHVQPQVQPQVQQQVQQNPVINTTQQVPNFNQLYTQPQTNVNPQIPFGQPYGQPYGMQQTFGQPFAPQPYGQSFNQPYGQPYGMQQTFGQPFNQPFVQPSAPQVYNQPYQNYQAPPVGLTLQPKNQAKTQITLSTGQSKAQQDDFGNFQSATSQATANVKWLSNDEKGLIDFSDFSSQIKNNPGAPNKPKKQQKGNNIVIDPWKW